MIARVLTLIVAVGLIVGCASNTGGSRAREISIRYGKVLDVTRVPVPSAAPAGAVVGGLTGLMLARKSSTGKQVASGIGGAALGGLLTHALEGDRRAFQYRLRFTNGTETNYITENGFLHPGDCIAVERDQYANLRRVSDDYCLSMAVPEVAVAKRTTEASQCHAAKEQLLAATAQEDIERASQKVRVLCQF